MKSIYIIGEVLTRALTTAGYDVPKLVNAVQSAKNDGTLVNDPDATAKDSGVKAKAKGTEASWAVSKREEYQARMNDPLRFAAFSDSLNAHFKKHGEPHAEITEAIIPAGLYVWLEKFRVKASVPVDLGNGVKGTAKPQGKRSNGNIEKHEAPVS